MKKKHRNITVEGMKFAWSIKNDVDGDGGNRLTIFHKKKLLFDELYGGHIDITPKLVSDVIKEWCFE